MPIFMLFSRFNQWDIEFIVQVLIVELAVELLRIATVHTPEAVSNAMGNDFRHVFFAVTTNDFRLFS